MLYKLCGHHARLPSAIHITVSYDRDGGALYRGGFADVWKGNHSGRDIAVKVIRTYSESNLRGVIGVRLLFTSICIYRCTDSVLCRHSARRL